MVIATTYLTRFIYSAVNYIFAIILFSQFAVYKRDKKIAISALIVTAIGCGAIFAAFCEIPHLSLLTETIYWFVSALPLFVVQKLFSKDNFMRDCILLLTQANVVMFMVTMMYYFSLHVFSHDFRSSLFFSAVTYLVIFVFYAYGFRAIYKRMVATTDPQRRIHIWNLYLIIPVAFLILQTTLVSIDDVSSSKLYCLVVLFTAATMLLVYVVMFFTFKIFEEKQKVAEQNMHLSAQNSMWLQQLEQNEKTVENTRRARHDLRHHDAFLMSLMDEKKYDDAREYLSEHLRRVEALQPVVYCKNSGINGILQAITESARSFDVQLDVQAVVPSDFNADLVDMCGLFFNLAENAVNECKKLPPEKRYLKISATCENGRLALSVANPCADTVELYDGHPVRKGDRDGGVGTRSVIGIVEKYNGVITYTFENGVFTANAILFGHAA